MTVTCLALFTACGGGMASEGGGGAAIGGEPAAVPVAPAEAAETGGTARQGERCDYGGADRYTCGGGLECCYGEHATSDGYGTCQAECNWD